jgi:hypothetical protein
MATSVFQRVVLTMESNWNIGNELTHLWRNSFYLSGTIDHSQAEAELLALDLYKPIQRLTVSASLVGWDYYKRSESVSSASASYPVGTHKADSSGYNGTASAMQQQLEVCILARCPVGKNTRGKEVYLRKWIHNVLGSAADPNTVETLNAPSIVLAEWDTGAGPHDCVPVDPTSGAQGGPWQLETHLYTHQLRRGSKRKAAASGDGIAGLLDDLGKAAAIAKALELAGGA